jgi:toxin YoeB
MELLFTEEAWEDYLYWQTHDKKTLKKVNRLLKDITRQPYSGLGAPEALKHGLAGYWSQRITLEHRLVYRIHQGQVRVIQCRYHY